MWGLHDAHRICDTHVRIGHEPHRNDDPATNGKQSTVNGTEKVKDDQENGD